VIEKSRHIVELYASPPNLGTITGGGIYDLDTKVYLKAEPIQGAYFQY
jgi:hypothetical protein